MHFVAALDAVPEMHSVLALFEGVATGAADGYARMAGRPQRRCCTWGRAWATAWRTCTTPDAAARRSSTSSATTRRTTQVRRTAPVRHRCDRLGCVQLDPQLDATRPRRADAADAVAAAMGPPGQVATLILPADVSWSTRPVPSSPWPRPVPGPSSDRPSSEIAAVLRSGEPTALLVGGSTMFEPGLVAGSRVGGQQRRQAARRDVPCTPRARRGAAGRRAARLPGRVRPGAARRHHPPGAGRHRRR